MAKGLFSKMREDRRAEADSDKFIDLGEMDAGDFEMEGEGSRVDVKVAELHRFEDLSNVTTHVYKGSVLVIDFSAIASDDTAMRRMSTELKAVARDVKGDVAGIAKNMLVVTPAGMTIDRKVLRGPF
ncbi:MAG TPA: cell division protein SepF [Candidatus Thermoplasmatota archaeon]|nr:cell division protein SepF [Candidatus Thermoplasmatota archaeon]